MFQKGLSQSTRQNLALLSKLHSIKDFYLAGGTACALRLGHRLSFDLDFFTPKRFNSSSLARQIEKLGNFQVEQRLPDTLLGKLTGEKISFFTYSYPLIGKLEEFEGIMMADLPDLAAMKIEAISGRGKKRDFIDLYFLSQKISLQKILNFYDRKYQVLAVNLYHLLRSLVYFIDAEKEEMPQMITPVSWEQVKEFFTAEVKKISEELLR